MDMSKLPRLSNTPASPSESKGPGDAAPPPSAAPAAAAHCPDCGAALRGGAQFCDACGLPLRRGGKLAIGTEAFISIGIGVILLLFVPFFKRSLEYFFSRSHPESFTWTFSGKNGNPLAYPDSAYYLPDIGLTAFALALILEGLSMPLWNRFRVVLVFAIAVSIGVVAFNIHAAMKTYTETDSSEKFLSAIVILFGVYASLFQIGVYRTIRRNAQLN